MHQGEIMKANRYVVSPAILLATLITSSSAAEAGLFRHANRPVPGQYIVIFKGEVPEANLDREINRIAFKRTPLPTSRPLA